MAWKNRKILLSLEEIDPWQSFLDNYLDELGKDVRLNRADALGEWNGIEDGLPLKWHFDNLIKAGFKSLDCFYRFYGDAIYGGIRA